MAEFAYVKELWPNVISMRKVNYTSTLDVSVYCPHLGKQLLKNTFQCGDFHKLSFCIYMWT